MRSKVVFALLASLSVALVAALALRSRTATPPSPAPPGPSAAATPAGAIPASSASAVEPSTRVLDRPLAVVAAGWDLAAPALLANDGPSPLPSGEFAKAGLEARIAVVDGMSEALSALARGGQGGAGADVGLAPLPSLVASYEKLEALELEVFFVVGFSRGRHALYASAPSLLGTAPVVGGGPDEAAALLGLFVLDWEGAGKPRLASAGQPATLVAVDRAAAPEAGRDPESRLVLTTAEATHLVPYVAFAQRSLIAKHPQALEGFVKAYLAGLRALAADPPEAARKVAQAPGAPPPLALLEHLGGIAPASLRDNVRVLGLSGRGAARIDRLFLTSWRLLRAAGVLTTPPPKVAPVATGVVEGLVRADPSLLEAPAPSPPMAPSASASSGPRPGKASARKVLVTYRHPGASVDDRALLDAIGVAAAVFSRSPLRLSVGGPGRVDPKKTKQLIAAATTLFDLPPSRLVAAEKPVPGTVAALEVLSAP